MDKLIENINLDFLLGFLSAVVVPVFSKVLKMIRKHKEVSRFKKMIKKEYLDKVTLNDAIYKPSNLVETCERLDYLKSEELIYLNEPYQFEFIRIIEFTKIAVKKMNELGSTFRYPEDTEKYLEDLERLKQKFRAEFESIKSQYNKKINKYIKLETEFLE